MVSSPVLSSGSPESTTANALVVLLAQGDEQGAASPLGEIGATLRAEIEDAVAALRLTGKLEETAALPAPAVVAAQVLVLAGVGTLDGEVAPEAVRRAAGAAARQLTGRSKVAVVAPSTGVDVIAATAEGAALGGYAFDRYKAAESSPEVIVLTPSARRREAKAALTRSAVVIEAVTQIRDLVNTAPADLPPAEFADIAKRAAKSEKIGVKVLDLAALRAGGYGGIVGVGQGSAHEPRLVTLTYAPARAKAHVALVGKGITFDSGGLSIKPATGMVTMKSDMAGAATVLHTILAAAKLALPVKVTAFLALAENMPSGSATRPGDVLTMRGGKTVEVLNTDAEGRLVMADAIVDAVALEPDLIIDIATLTGAQVVALGPRVSAVMGTEQDRTAVVAAAGTAGELAWPMPLPEELRAGLDSPIADLANIGDRMGGMLSAGLFLKEFTADRAWVHVDFAGPSFNEGKPWGYTPKGGTGAGLRTLLAYLESRAE